MEKVSEALQKSRDSLEKSMKKIGEEAIQEPTHIMDNIIAKNDKFETINVLLIILCKELGISTESQPKEVLMGIGKVYEEYYKAMDDFRNLKNGNQGRDEKNISKDHENGQK